jgi:hypothetical protein
LESSVDAAGAIADSGWTSRRILTTRASFIFSSFSRFHRGRGRDQLAGPVRRAFDPTHFRSRARSSDWCNIHSRFCDKFKYGFGDAASPLMPEMGRDGRNQRTAIGAGACSTKQRDETHMSMTPQHRPDMRHSGSQASNTGLHKSASWKSRTDRRVPTSRKYRASAIPVRADRAARPHAQRNRSSYLLGLRPVLVTRIFIGFDMIGGLCGT